MMIEGLKQVSLPNGNGFYFYNENMLRDKILIETSHDYVPETDEAVTNITVIYQNDLDAHYFVLYDDVWLAPIMLRRLILDILELYEKNPHHQFISMIQDLCTQHQSAMMQSSKKAQKEIKDRIQTHFDYIQNISKNERQDDLF